jgi:hypothetical protein
MWFTWIGSFFINGVTFLLSKFTIQKAGLVIVIPMYIVYIGAIFVSWGLFLAVIIQVVNSAFDIINMVNNQNSGTSSTPVFKCFFYLLNALGVSDALKTGIALIVSDLLAIMVLKGATAFQTTTKELISITNNMFQIGR